MAAFIENAACVNTSLTISLEGQEATCSCFSGDGSWLAVSHISGIIQIYRVEDGRLSFTLRKNSIHKFPCLSVCFRPTDGLFSTKNVLISGDVSGQVNHWHASSGKLISTIEEPGNEIFAVAHQEAGVLFATAGLDAKVRVYDGLTRKLIKVLDEGNGVSTMGHTNRVFALKWNSLDSHVIFSGGWDKTVQVWDSRSGKSVRSIFGPYLCGAALDFDADTDSILTGSWRTSEQLQEWNYGSGALVRTFSWPQKMNFDKPCQVYSACYGKGMSRNVIAAGGTSPNQASVFDKETSEFLGGLQPLGKGVVSLSFNRSGSQMSLATINKVFVVNMQDFAKTFSMATNPCYGV